MRCKQLLHRFWLNVQWFPLTSKTLGNLLNRINVREVLSPRTLPQILGKLAKLLPNPHQNKLMGCHASCVLQRCKWRAYLPFGIWQWASLFTIQNALLHNLEHAIKFKKFEIYNLVKTDLYLIGKWKSRC